jgi:hypothetical protein
MDKTKQKFILDGSVAGNRRLIAGAAIEKGQTIVQEKPILSCPHSESAQKVCHTCLEEVKDIKRCPSCKYAHYCSSEHQLEDWKAGHKQACAIFKKVGQEGQRSIPVHLSLVIKLFVRVELEKDAALEAAVAGMKSHLEDMSQEDLDLLRMTTIMGTVKSYDGKNDTGRLMKYMELLERVALNSFTIFSQSNHEVGIATGVFSALAWANHSCQPNAFVCFSHGSNRLVSCRDIAANEEICISYIPVLDGYATRQADLLKRYYFKCSCARCIRDKQSQGGANSKGSEVIPSNSVVANRARPKDVDPQVWAAIKGYDMPELDLRWNALLEGMIGERIGSGRFQEAFLLGHMLTPKLLRWMEGMEHSPVVGYHFQRMSKLASYLGLGHESFEYSRRALLILRSYYTGDIINELEIRMLDAQRFLEGQRNM